MEEVISCPSGERLAAFYEKKLNADEQEVIRRHLDGCPKCVTRLVALEADCQQTTEPLASSPASPMAPDTVLLHSQSDTFSRPGQASTSLGSTRHGGTLSTSHGTPSSLGPYRIVRELGHGGMGTVYEAIHVHLKKRMAVKVLPAERVHDPQAVARFYREMEALGALAHPNIVSATDAGEAEGRHYLAMEYVEGVDLSSLVRRHGPLALADAAEVIRQAAVGLQYAHEHGRVHRDIKPANLMLSRRGEIKILDLGLSLLAESRPAEEELTLQGQMMGTADYVAPEQWLDSHRVDIRADIYSLGCTLYKLLTGTAPFSSPDCDTLYRKRAAHLEAPVPTLPDWLDLPASFQPVLARMLAKDPEQRFATPAALAEALQPFTAGADLCGLCRRGEGDLPAAPPVHPIPPNAFRHPSGPLASPPPEVRRTEHRALPWVRALWGKRVLCALALVGGIAALVLLASPFLGKRPPASSDPRSPETPVASWRRLPESEPVALLWPDDTRNSRWHWDAEQGQLDLTCSGAGLLRLAETRCENYKLEVAFYQVHWGGAGIIFGHRPVEIDGKAGQQWQQIRLLNAAVPPEADRFYLEWTVASKVPHGLGRSTAAAVAEISELGDQDQRLTITVEKNVLRGVRWNGVEKMPRFQTSLAVVRKMAQLDADCRGGLGVYCARTTVFVRNCRLWSKAEP